MTTEAQVDRAAYEADVAGLCIVPPSEDGAKRPWPDESGKWERFKTTRATPEEFKRWYPGRTGIGVIAGAVSGYVESWDFDDCDTYRAFLEAAEAAGLFPVIERIEDGCKDATPSGGVRWLVRYPAHMVRAIRPKLACRPKEPAERKHDHDLVKTLIEMPAYAVVAPSNGNVHPSGRPYVRVSGGFGTIAAYSADERSALVQLARSFDVPIRPTADESRRPGAAGNGGRPGDDFNARATWAEVLEPHGWRAVYTRGDVTCWRRPGKETPGISATTNHAGSGLLYVFSSATPFEPERGYSKFSACALLTHAGDFAATAADLAGHGYGEPAGAPGPTTSGPDVSGGSGQAGADGLPADALADAVDVAREGQRIAAEGIPYTVDGMIPALGMLGFLVAYAKVGKTTFGYAIGSAAAMGRPIVGRITRRTRVLAIAAEDPPEYVAWLARDLDVEPGWMTFYRGPLILTMTGLAQISHTITAGGYGLVLIASWQAVIRGLVRDENDNAGAVCVVEAVKAAARATGVPWLIDAHSGKGEDQADEADPSRAMRGASSAAGSADYTLSLRYANGAFGTQRKLSGRGRFVSLEPILMDFDATTSQYTALGTSKNAAIETVWRLILETGALIPEPRPARAIAHAAGLVGSDGKPTKNQKRQVGQALAKRDGVLMSEEMRCGKQTWLYRQAPGESV